jgi:hypothetical protein
MLTWGSKFFFALSIGSLIGAVVYGVVTGGSLGVISAGYKGGIGEHLGYTVLAFAAAALFLLGVVMVVVRDGDAEIMAARAGSDIVPPVSPPNDASYWGPLTAFGVAAVIIGVALNQLFLYLGIGALAVVAFMWTVLDWSDRATGDPEVNRTIRSRVLGPVEIPMLGMLAIAVVAIGVSRVFLAVPNKESATIAGSLFTLFVFGSAVLLSKVEVKRQVVTGIVAAGALAVLAGGIIGAAAGERDFEHHGEDAEHSESEG